MSRDSKGLNVLMVTPRYFPYMGGIETHVHEVGRLLSHRGINITLLTTMPHIRLAQLPREEFVERMHVIRVPSWPSERDYYIAPEIYSFIKNGKWDLIHCQGCHTFVPPLAMRAAKEAKIPYVLTFHTGGHSSGLRNRIRGLQWRLLRSELANAAKLIGVSHFEANYFCNLLHLPARQFTVIPNGSAVPDIPQLSISKPEHTIIVSVGRLERYKGHHHLITALPYIRKWRSDARLLILGKGPYEAELRMLAREVGVANYVEIRSVKADDRKGMAEILVQAELVALLSEYEAHPIAVMEALALRRPVLVSNSSGLGELAEQGLVRAIPLKSSPEEIAQAVRLQIEEPLLPSVNLTLPTWEQCADQLQMVYQASIREE